MLMLPMAVTSPQAEKGENEMDFMIYKYSVSYANGTKLNGYAIDDDNSKTESEVKASISRHFLGNYRLVVKKYGAKFPPINTDYLLTV